MAVEEKNKLAEEFDRDQIAEIKAGMEKGLDISCYAKTAFMAIQMRQIRLGLEEGIPVEAYADPEYDWFQMEEIRKGIEQGLDIGLYADKGLSYDKMRQIRKGLKKGIDLSRFSQLDAKLLQEIRKAFEQKLDMMDYILHGYEAEQLEQIRYALEKKLDIDPYLIREFRGASIREIARGLENGVEVAYYARIEYGWRQMREIRLGLEHRLDISAYANPLYDWRQMCEIRLGLEEGLDVTGYQSLMYPAADMKRQRLQLKEKTEAGSTEGESRGDGRFALMVSRNEMEAYLQINGNGEETFSLREMVAFLQKEGIVYGIQEEAAERLLQEKLYGQPVLIAKGDPAKKGKDGWYEFFFRTELKRNPRVLSDGSVDYQDIEWFETVTKGQKLALYHPAEKGKNGWTVTGKLCRAAKGKEAGILYGKGFRVSEDRQTYYADMDGKIELCDNRMEINRICILDEVTQATGNLDFDGCIYIRGNVGSNTCICATEDIVIDGTVEGATLKSGSDILLKKGINGARTGSVEAAGSIVGGFFEAVRVQAGEDIKAGYCLNCELHAGGFILLSGKKGSLVGGNSYAERGLRAYHLGNKAGALTRLCLGINERVWQEKKNLERSQEENQKEIQILRNACTDFETRYSPEQRNSMEMYLKLESAIYTKEKQKKALQEKAGKLEERIADMGHAKAVISGQVHGGTEVIMDSVKWQAAAELCNVSIVKLQNRIAVYANG